MKKILIIILILAALTGAGLLAGWAEFAVPPGHYGVLQSKSHGLYPMALEGGGRTWIWYKLLPTNTKTAAFNLSPQIQAFQTQGELPQATVYQAFTGIKAAFSYEIHVTLEWALKKESLPRIISENDISTQSDLNVYLSHIKEQIQQLIAERFHDSRETRLLLALKAEEDTREWRVLLETAFDFLEVRDLIFTLSKEPDIEHYETAKTLYARYIDGLNEMLQNSTVTLAGERVASQFRLDELVKYGELFTKYPVLIDYLKITGGAAAVEKP